LIGFTAAPLEKANAYPLSNMGLLRIKNASFVNTYLEKGF
jgi:hypothetical protein